MPSAPLRSLRALSSALAVATVVALAPSYAVRPATAVPPPGAVVVATANLYEGAVLPIPRDLADDSDVRRFARRFATLNPDPPDVVALQEVRGSVARVVRQLNRVMRGRASYAVVTRPGLFRDRGRCMAPRRPFTVVRDGALVVNTATTRVLERGRIRTWGRWLPTQRGVLRRSDAAGCAENPWARVRVTRGDTTREALVVGTHLGPMGRRLKTVAMRELGERSRAIAAPGELVVLAGDFNLPWCARGRTVRESAGCAAVRGHRELVARGFTDVLRAAAAAEGALSRVDFIHTTGQVVAARWDRCYRPRLAPPCAGSERVFPSERVFRACQRRAIVFGRAGGACGARAYARYYSDHPIITATVT